MTTTANPTNTLAPEDLAVAADYDLTRLQTWLVRYDHWNAVCEELTAATHAVNDAQPVADLATKARYNAAQTAYRKAHTRRPTKAQRQAAYGDADNLRRYLDLTHVVAYPTTVDGLRLVCDAARTAIAALWSEVGR